MSLPPAQLLLRWKAVNSELHLLFAEEYRALRPRAPIPSLEIRFRRFTSLNTTIRLREGRVHVHLSDLLELSLIHI